MHPFYPVNHGLFWPFPGGGARKLPPFKGWGMSKHTLTPEEEAAYADLAAAAARLRKAQKRADKRKRRRVGLPHPAHGPTKGKGVGEQP